jgi:hypothetical protein
MEADKTFKGHFGRWAGGSLIYTFKCLEKSLPKTMQPETERVSEIQPEIEIEIPKCFSVYCSQLSDFYKQVLTRWGYSVKARIGGRSVFISFIFKDATFDAVKELLKKSNEKLASKAK